MIDVDDLEIAEDFWSELTGLPVIPSVFPGRYSYIGRAEPWKHELTLHLVKTPKGVETNRGHVDIGVCEIDVAIGQIEAIGGTLKRAPTIYPRPGTYDDEPAQLDWAVMRDPFGNEFCLVRVLTVEESAAVKHAAEAGQGDDHHWRVAAGVTSTPHN